MVELMVPRDPEVAERIHGFYDSIGWDVRNASGSEFDTLASPDVGAFQTPTIAYWQTENPAKIAHFADNPDAEPSAFAQGLRLPQLMDLIEVTLIVPTDDHVHDIFGAGGSILEAHAHIPPREHAGRQEFRFGDPFNYAIRVTANPGYEVNVSDHPLVGKRIDHVEGTSYVIDDVVIRAQGYEKTGSLEDDAVYTQIVAGGYPAGTRYSRTEDEILSGTTFVDGREVPIFDVRDQ